MPQFDVYLNPNSESRKWAPYLVDLQHEMLSGMHTRIMAPLVIAKPSDATVIQRLNPIIAIDAQDYYLSTAEMAAVPVRELSEATGNLSSHRDELLAAIDLIFTAL